VGRVIPYGVATAMISALAISVLYPRFGRVACFSALGLTILFAATLILVSSRRPDWLAYVPPEPQEQAGALAVIWVIGIFLQSALLPRKRRAKRKSQEEETTTNDAPMVAGAARHKFA
jgi:hypothetical protein